MRVHTDTGTPAPPAFGFVTTCRVPFTPAEPDVVIGGLPIRSSGSFGYEPTVCTSVLLAFSPGIRATLTKVTIATLVPPTLPHGIPAATPEGSDAKHATGATP